MNKFDSGRLLTEICFFQGLKLLKSIFFDCMSQESSEGQKMLDFRKSLPSHEARETLLHAISQNQVLVELITTVEVHLRFMLFD